MDTNNQMRATMLFADYQRTGDPEAVAEGEYELRVPTFDSRLSVQVSCSGSPQGFFVDLSTAKQMRDGQDPVALPLGNSILDSKGRTEFRGLPAGRYTVAVTKDFSGRQATENHRATVEISAQQPHATARITYTE